MANMLSQHFSTYTSCKYKAAFSTIWSCVPGPLRTESPIFTFTFALFCSPQTPKGNNLTLLLLNAPLCSSVSC